MRSATGDWGMESGFSHQKVTSSAKHQLPSVASVSLGPAAEPSILAPTPWRTLKYRYSGNLAGGRVGGEELSSGKEGVWRRDLDSNDIYLTQLTTNCRSSASLKKKRNIKKLISELQVDLK